MSNTEEIAETRPVFVPSLGIREVDGEQIVRNAAGKWVPVAMIKTQHLREDQTVRKIIGYALELNARISRFRGHTFDDVASFQVELEKEYGGKRGGEKGNVTLTSFDGLMKVVVSVQDRIRFGPEVQEAKRLVDACIASWSPGARPEMLALIGEAFDVDREGKINSAALFRVRRLNIEDADWQEAMRALGDAIVVEGSREYVRFYLRGTAKDRWTAITVDLASA